MTYSAKIRTYFFVKRVMDLAFSVGALIVLSPLMFVIAVMIKKDSHGPVFYKGLRVGRYGRSFRMLKFRTMVEDAAQKGGTSTSSDDPRITRIGSVLRRSKLDELPQLLNVVWGQMSLVGPRPQVSWAVELYTEDQKKLLSVRPGITDYASIRFRNEAEILCGSADPDGDYLKKIAPEKIRLSLEYVNCPSLKADFRIIWVTLSGIFGFKKDRMFERPSLTSGVEKSGSENS